ncbi:inositol monophosphatase [uncultured Roseibium sp.]|uniref:inositol monophosphatase family protein n=1 Tax=uncultured Roseibium sp. TaxID=1936171 RepID=UPI0026360625|nr:inositol monophosphatase [uncultured Roseibium sp.]
MSVDQSALGEIIREAGRIVAQSSISRVETKSRLDYVTDIDHRVDDLLTEKLSKLTPGVPVFSEERAMKRPDRAFWIIDPVDGTHNMMAGVPHVAVCVALFEGLEAKVGAVLDVVADRFFIAEKGKGATVNGERLKRPQRPSGLMGLSSGTLDALMSNADIYRSLRKKGKLRNLGSQALQLCYVADGRLGFTVSKEARFWDDAAGRLIAEESGARYKSFAAETDEELMQVAFSKQPLRSLCAHPDEFEDVSKLLYKLWSGQS